ncbi:hypothetical protein QYE76_011612 [Lolium multiflorum]|uniref:Peroxidase n=1 Tax=Lolium multiflorum TaxID=4521 RepID=A0AAD8TVP4_LOLMU|nr:hypothetical protein QYE76_011612 [Lolium multiflorum]
MRHRVGVEHPIRISPNPQRTTTPDAPSCSAKLTTHQLAPPRSWSHYRRLTVVKQRRPIEARRDNQGQEAAEQRPRGRAQPPPPPALHFYAQSCPRAETIVRQVVQHRAAQDRSVLPALIRLQFHDCFVRGCDGSVLIDSAGGNVAEKEADPNLTLRMLDVIDDVKAALETACPGVVSCADIIGLAARDAAAMAGRVRYQLPTGRRDGTVSSAAEVHLPSPSVSFADALSAFSNIGLDVVDLTTLLGSHTMGFCHFMFVMDRLYDFKKTGTPDQTMDAGLRASLQGSCPPHTVTP